MNNIDIINALLDIVLKSTLLIQQISNMTDEEVTLTIKAEKEKSKDLLSKLK